MANTKKAASAPAAKESGEANTKKAEGYVYPVWEKWLVDVSAIANPNPKDQEKKYKLTAIKIERSNIKIADNEADTMNAQSHNTQRRYYLKGSITNGHEEVITVQ